MTFLGKRIAVALPDTVLEEHDSLREKTVKLGTIARACSIYGVDVIQVFSDAKGRGEAPLIRKVLGYLETPQYLRKRLFPLDQELKYAGLLPPLRIPSHKKRTPLTGVRAGEFREGVANPDGTADVGLEKPLSLNGSAEAGKRVTVRVTSSEPLVGEAVSRDQVDDYWGYTVENRRAAEVLDDPRFGLTVATSRYGDSLRSKLSELERAVAGTPSVLLVFGSPSRGLFDILGREAVRKAGFVLNLFAEQHVETVRTEEAVFAALNLVSVLAL